METPKTSKLVSVARARGRGHLYLYRVLLLAPLVAPFINKVKKFYILKFFICYLVLLDSLSFIVHFFVDPFDFRECIPNYQFKS